MRYRVKTTNYLIRPQCSLQFAIGPPIRKLHEDCNFWITIYPKIHILGLDFHNSAVDKRVHLFFFNLVKTILHYSRTNFRWKSLSPAWFFSPLVLLLYNCRILYPLSLVLHQKSTLFFYFIFMLSFLEIQTMWIFDLLSSFHTNTFAVIVFSFWLFWLHFVWFLFISLISLSLVLFPVVLTHWLTFSKMLFTF